ncbi:MAG TPA: hypothetical protein VGF97_09270 [Rhizomicrobium sp.]|jgi:hypothetical protein
MNSQRRQFSMQSPYGRVTKLSASAGEPCFGVPPRRPSAMPDQVIAIWTPFRAVETFVRMIAGFATSPFGVRRARADDSA